MNSSGGLQRTIGLPQAVALYIGAVLGSGILIVPGLAAEIAGPASLLAWGLMALLIFPLAWSMGLLSAQYPNAGGVSHFVTLAYGRRAGTLTGWFFLMSVPIGAPVAALTGAGYMTAALGWGEQAKIAIAAGMLVLALLVNYVGMKIAGQLQLIVVLAILAVLILAIAGAQPHIQAGNLTPFLPHGWVSVGQAAAILFWCFIGWEAVSHLSEEFQEPKKAAIQGVTAAALIVGVLYFLTAFAVVGTGSYRGAASDASLVWVILRLLGPAGAWISGITGIFICTATIIAYAGASSRLAYALAREGEAPRWMGGLSARFGTPTGGLGFLAITAAAVLTLYGSGAVSLAELIQFPNATFILTYLGGCAAGMKLLRGSRWGKRVSTLSFACTLTVFPFVGWAMLYPIVIVLVYWLVSRVRAAKASRSRSASQAS